ncbi:hypothetical protein BG011_002955 [Mortierella polycephala]|uniref:RRM Nup35-type domain-containing protein n=1 Tax=Mortierella polycephala TaxID=41804 RepID=A0A9P6QIE9_9FUNG|nr:hypothetical protein BG011_002955 [Mortierella polycephala]
MSMFTFNASGPLSGSQGSNSSRTSTGKSTYVPSTYIARQLQLEEEARRKQESNHGNDTHTNTSTSASYMRGPNDVLAPGYLSGPLGYQSSPSSISSQMPRTSLGESSASQGIGPVQGAGVGAGSSQQSESTPNQSRMYPELYGSGNTSSFNRVEQTSFHEPGTPSSAPKSILRSEGRPETNNNDQIRRGSIVRFSSVAPELGSPRPSTPPIYCHGGSNPFYANNHISPSSSLSNLHSALKEDDKVDVLSHRAAAGASMLNSSLGPALGSVSGATQQTQMLSSKMQNEMNTSLMRGSPFSGAGSGSSFYSTLDSNAKRQQSSKFPSPFGKSSRDEDEEDKDKERYMPAILLGNAPGLKGSKVEPFVNGDPEWDKDGYSRLAPHLIGEDAPPADTLYDIAQKEKYYSQPASLLTSLQGSSQDNRSDADTNQGTGSSTVFSASQTNASYDSVITYGFSPEATSYILNQFRAFGTIERYETGVYGRVESESFNWLKIQFGGMWAARNATSRHLKSVGKFVVGVQPCPSFSTRNPTMAMDTNQASELTEAEAKELEAGVETLLKMRAQGLSADSVQIQAAAATKARHASLYESYSQGGSGGLNQSLGQSPFALGASSYTPASTLGESTSKRPSAHDPVDDDMAYILGHSLTSGGSLARSTRGRPFERENTRLRSQSKEAQEQDLKRGGASINGADRSMSSENPSAAGFRPLFSLNDSRGLNSGAGSGQDSVQQHQQQQHYQQQQNQQQQQQQQQDSFMASHRLTLRRNLGESTMSDTTLFASSGGVLLDTTSSPVAVGSSRSPVHVLKKQRLSSSLPPSSSSSFHNDNVSLSQFGKGKDRASLLIDDPELVDEWGTPRLSKMASSTSSAGTGAAANGVKSAPESMVSSVLNMAKKRLFWG